MSKSSLLGALATSFLSGEPTIEQIVTRASRTLGKNWRWLRPLALRYVKTFAGRTRPRQRDVVHFLRHDAGFRRAWSQHRYESSVEHWLTEPQRMQPVAAAKYWDVPEIESTGALAAWLGVSIGELHWFADLARLAYKENSPKLRHYHYRILAQRFGSIRLIEAQSLG
jgi:hypothetical protein